MKKVIKSISVLVLSLSLVFSGFVFAGNVKADEVSDWKANAIKTPTEGNLLGAGYIDVEFDNSLSGYFYEVFLDNKPVYWDGNSIVNLDIEGETIEGKTRREYPSGGSGSTTTSEVYTTKVAKHEITIKATKGSETIVSNPRTIYVSKKGLAMGDNMGTKVSLQKLNCSWYYNWGTKGFNNYVDARVQHIPMMWGGYEDSIEDMNNLSTTSNYILGFNEPDIGSQANMNFWDAVDVWNGSIAPLKMRKVSPGPAAPSGNSSWLQRFMYGDYICHNTWLNDGSWGLFYDYKDEASKKFVEGVDSDVDAVALHFYQDRMDADGIVEAVNNLWITYHKPVWITEIGLFGKKGTSKDYSYEQSTSRAEIQSYLQDIVSRLNNIDYVERFCWFPYDIDSTNDIDEFDGSGGGSMFEYATGLYTDLGKAYAAMGNPSGYNAYVISDSESFDYNNRVDTSIYYDENTDRLSVSWSTGQIQDFSRVVVSIDGQEYLAENGSTIDVSDLDNNKHSVKFTFYDASNNVIVEKAKAFTIKRSETTTPETTTETKPTEPVTNKPEVVTTNKKVVPVKPSKVVLSKSKNVKKKSVKLSWSAVSGANKYKVNWAMNKKFSKKAKTKIVLKPGLKVTKLKKKKTYYFRVAAINTAGTGPWSNVKKVKIKK